MAGFLDEVIAFARGRAGDLSEEELSADDFICVVLPIVIHEFSQLVPQRGSYEIQLVAGQKLYDLPGPNIFMITDNSAVEGSTINHINLGEGFSRVPFANRDRGFSSPWVTAYSQETVDRLVVDAVYIVGGKVQVDPTPTSAETLYIETFDLWDFSADPNLDTLPRMYQLGFKYLGAAEVLAHAAGDREGLPRLKICDSSLDLGPKALRDQQFFFISSAQRVLGPHGIQIMEA